MDTVLDSAFADPVLDSQAVFRALMHALANPGKPQKLVTPRATDSHLSPELVSTLLALTDHDTSIWLDQTLGSDNAITQFVGFHTGAKIVDAPAKAHFAFACAAETLPRLDQFNLGTQEYPDRSTTVVLAVPSLSGGADIVLRGPVVNGQLHCNPTGLPEDILVQWAENRELFPRGIDLLLVADGQVMGLPRSTRIEGGKLTCMLP